MVILHDKWPWICIQVEGIANYIVRIPVINVHTTWQCSVVCVLWIDKWRKALLTMSMPIFGPIFGCFCSFMRHIFVVTHNMRYIRTNCGIESGKQLVCSSSIVYESSDSWMATHRSQSLLYYIGCLCCLFGFPSILFSCHFLCVTQRAGV